jgi:hypothetical protein
MNILLENSATIKSDSDYNEIIAKPTIRKAMPREVETVQSSEDQEFLSKLMVVLNKNATTVKTVIKKKLILEFQNSENQFLGFKFRFNYVYSLINGAFVLSKLKE